ncbi:MAG: hypothetical protein IPJ41_06810 [Phycisphaerales bacterium]|nr:hypothetical protein [Phycisphaerales bacterium]
MCTVPRARFGSAAIVAASLMPLPALAGPWAFTRIANSATPVPSGSGTFNALFQPSVSAGRVAFRGFSAGHNGTATDWQGVYTNLPGSLSAVVSGSSFSGYTVPFDPSIDGATVAFHQAQPANQAVSTWSSGVTTLVADKFTNAPPGGSGPFDGLSRPSVHAGKVAFEGFASPPTLSGLFTNATGALSNTIRDGVTPIPGGSGAFTGAGDPDFDGSQFAFIGFGNSGQQGVYLTTPAGSVAVVADKTTLVPGGTGVFSFLSSLPSFDGADVAFQAFGTGGEKGVYRTAGGLLAAVADQTTPIPGGVGAFTGFANEPAIDGAYVAFIGSGSGGQNGIFLDTNGGSLQEVITAGALLDGKIVQSLDIGREAIDAQTLGFWARFTDGTEGVYVTTIPTPSALALLSLGAAAGLRRRRRA